MGNPGSGKTVSLVLHQLLFLTSNFYIYVFLYIPTDIFMWECIWGEDMDLERERGKDLRKEHGEGKRKEMLGILSGRQQGGGRE